VERNWKQTRGGNGNGSEKEESDKEEGSEEISPKEEIVSIRRVVGCPLLREGAFFWTGGITLIRSCIQDET